MIEPNKNEIEVINQYLSNDRNINEKQWNKLMEIQYCTVINISNAHRRKN